jgi:hypothetical protein
MKRRRALVCSSAAAALAFAGAAAALEPRAACSFVPEGTWILATPNDSQPTVLTFANGWANVLAGPEGSHASDLEIVAQVRYALRSAADPTLEFTAARGDDLFPAGTSSWQVAAFGDESFAVLDAATGERALWGRVQTQRHFLTFAAQEGRDGRVPAAFLMWTTLDGKRPAFQTLGSHAEKDAAHFGPIPDALGSAFKTERGGDHAAMLRVEINAAEYWRSREPAQAWTVLAEADLLDEEDPYRATMELFAAAVQSVNRCGMRIALGDIDLTALIAASSDGSSSVPLTFVRRLRALNTRRHVTDKLYPAAWKPLPVN